MTDILWIVLIVIVWLAWLYLLGRVVIWITSRQTRKREAEDQLNREWTQQEQAIREAWKNLSKYKEQQ